MAKKKTAHGAKQRIAKPSVGVKARAKKKPVSSKKKAGSLRKTPATKSSGKPPHPSGKRTASLGRPKVPGTAELDQMFLKDYEARQVFAFLGVKTLKELEQHQPDEIIERLTGPLVKTVERIRKALAINNRYLAGDQRFAMQFSKLVR